MTEELQQPTSLNMEDAIDQLMAQSEALNEADDQVDAEDQEAVETDEIEAEVTDTDDETEEVETKDADDDTTEPSDDDELFVEIDGEEVSLAQLKEWREGGLKSADYTKKTQALAEERREVEASKIQIQQELQSIQAERAQLQDALAAAAIDGQTEPDWVELAQTLPPAEYQREQAKWHQKQAQRQQVAQAYEAMKAQQMEQVQRRELSALLQAKPEWADPQQFQVASQRMAAAVAPFGITPDELASITDHKQLLILDALASLSQEVQKVEQAKDAVSKRVVKAERRRKPGSKSSKSEGVSKALEKKQAKFKGTRKLDDAVDLLLAQMTNS